MRRLVFFVVLSFLGLRTEALQQEESPSFIPEIQRREETCRCSDISPLLNKLISDLEDVKGKILYEIPELLAKQTDDTEKVANDLKNIKELVLVHENKADSSNVKISGDLSEVKGCCTKQAEKTDNYLKYLSTIEASVIKSTREISESLLLHDQRLQKLAGKGFCHTTETRLEKDCSEVKSTGSSKSGVYSINVNNRSVEVYCDFSTPGGDWLVFQRRIDGSVDFYQNWTSYANGFGNASGEFWLGNEILHQLTSNRRYKLRVDLEDFEGEKRFAEYSSFSVGPPSDYYRLKIGSYSGDAGDSLAPHNGQQFTTYDVDRDTYSTDNCARLYRGAWWHFRCHESNLNGKFYRGKHSNYADGIDWSKWRGFYYSLKSEMKIAFVNP